MGYSVTVQPDHKLGAIILEVWDNEKIRMLLSKNTSFTEFQFANVLPINLDALMIRIWDDNALTRGEFIRIQDVFTDALNALMRYCGRPSDCPFIEKKES